MLPKKIPSIKMAVRIFESIILTSMGKIRLEGLMLILQGGTYQAYPIGARSDIFINDSSRP
jgi:hypothetical protein